MPSTLRICAALVVWTLATPSAAQDAGVSAEASAEPSSEPTRRSEGGRAPESQLDLRVRLEPDETLRGPGEVYWHDEWGTAGVPNFVLMGGSAAVALINIILGSDEENPDRGRNPFDEAGRDAFRLPVEQQRLVARDFSDGLLTALTSAPILIDALVLAAWQHESEEAAVQMILIHAEVVTFTLALQTTANVLLSRERPYGRTCGGGGADDFPEESFFCDSPDRYYSFFSGHTSQSFASAAVVCSFHANMPLLGEGPENLIPCFTAMAGAAATSMLRMVGDMHYATDVIMGTGVGLATGFLLPWLLHFGPTARPDDGSSSGDVAWTLIPTPNGAGLFGIW